jgi:hypothetical protein
MVPSLISAVNMRSTIVFGIEAQLELNNSASRSDVKDIMTTVYEKSVECKL